MSWRGRCRVSGSAMVMSSEVATKPVVARRRGIAAWFRRSEAAQGFALMSPALVVLIIGIAVPFVILVSMSLWTRDGFDFDTALELLHVGSTSSTVLYEHPLLT